MARCRSWKSASIEHGQRRASEAQRHRHQPPALINSVKLQRARKLLQSSRMTVDRVAEALGYQDATALRRLMKKVAGVNPGRYLGSWDETVKFDN
jgi:transcriptional regulator GlxA family with amidase domain